MRLSALFGLLAIALLACCGLAATAAAETYVVNRSEDAHEAEQCQNGNPCNLRAAMELANEHANQGGPDRIEFEIDMEYTPVIGEGPLPAITDPVVIDGTTAPGYDGIPRVFLNGEFQGGEGGSDYPTAFEVKADGTVIEGISFGIWAAGVYVNDARNVRLCGNWLGLARVEAGPEEFDVVDAPNAIGVETSFEAAGTLVGAGCGAVGGNVIGNNEWTGILDVGEGTVISANLIGLRPDGEPAPNGTQGGAPVPPSGIAIEEATGPKVGATKSDPGNVIAFNGARGVFVGNSAAGASIRHNSIHSNEGKGIEIEEAPPPVPVLQSFLAGPADTTVIGSLSGEPSTGYVLDFYSNAACDPGGAGEGKTYLGAATVSTDSGGKASFSAAGLAELLLGEGHVTATATEAATGATSEFSNCADAGSAPGPGPETGPAPDNGKTVVVGLVSGTVLVKPPGSDKFHPLGKDEEIPLGSVIDATKGKVKLTSKDPDGTTQTAEFHGGVFKVTQRKGAGLVVLKLVGGDFSSCRKAGASVSKRRGRHLWGSGKGNFRTEGRHGSATVRGTIWLTEDRCGATFFRTARGVVTIRDFDAHKTLKLPKGKTYLTQS